MIKRIFNLCVSLGLTSIDQIKNVGRLMIGMRPPARCVVFAYHAVSAEERSRFAWQMELLSKKAKPLPADIDQVPEKTGNFAVVTFDDGLENIIENALPELKKRGIPATLFIVTDTLGQNRAWEHPGGEETRNEKGMR